jgi:o-succinylbenzoate---CoA ligase
MFDLNLTTKELQFPHHPKLKEEAKTILNQLKSLDISRHVLLFSSGTTSHFPKGYGISLDALIAHADSVNRHLNLTNQDIWGLSLPDYHIGGLSVLIRASRSHSKVIALGKWDPMSWREKLSLEKITVTSIVPTQLFDVIKLNLNPPQDLKYLFVGGDYLSEKLRLKAVELGWPVLKTFGMTEVGSQLASQKNSQTKLEILDIHQIKIDQNHRLWVKTPSLFSFEFQLRPDFQLSYAKDEFDSEGFFPTKDRASILDNDFKHLGRLDDQLKISGRLISLFELKEKVHSYALKHDLFGKIEVQFKDDPRLGKKIIIYHTPGISIPNNLLSPFQFETHELESLERTDLGKFKVTKH